MAIVISLIPQSLADPKSQNNIHAIPEAIWDVHEVILDGTIIDINNKTWVYDIEVNQIFKGSINSKMISAVGFDVWNSFTKGDRALFYIYDISPISNHKYTVTNYSVKTTSICDARSLIQISPILPNDPIKIVRGHPDIPANWSDPCVPSYFEYDPDFFNFRDPTPPKMQLRHNLPVELIRCYDDKILIHKIDTSPACVKPESLPKLINRGWSSSTGPLSSVNENKINFENFDAVVEGTVLIWMGQKGDPVRYQYEIDVDDYIKFDGEQTEKLTILGGKETFTDVGLKAIFGLEYNENMNYYEIAAREPLQ